VHRPELISYTAEAQNWGTYLHGFPWKIAGCATFRKPVSATGAQVLFTRFAEKLEKGIGTPLSCFVASERRYSGCGSSPIPLHLHFLAASDQAEGLAETAQHLWEARFGNAKVDPYDPGQNGSYYVSKLACHANGDIFFRNLELLENTAPSDLIHANRLNPYVPEELKDKTHGAFLRIR
jgi:hypothetical protein